MKPKIHTCLPIFLIPVFLQGQVLPLQTAPFVGSDQLIFHPSRNISAGGLSIVAEDPIGDPYENPARGASVLGLTIFSTPTIVAPGDNATASMLSLGVQYGDPSLFGGLVAGRQETNEHQSYSNISNGGRNEYGHIFVGRRFPEWGTSFGASAMKVTIGRLVGLTPPGFVQTDREASFVEEFKIGMEQRLESGSRIDVVISRQYVRVPNPAPYFNGPIITDLWSPRVDFDQSLTWALQACYVQPLTETVHLGILASGNWKRFGELAFYETPSNAKLYQLGLGIARVGKESMVGLEASYEPAVANFSQLPWMYYSYSNSFGIVNSDLRFSNWTGRVGIRSDRRPLGLSFGVQFHAVRYTGRYESGGLVTNSDNGWNEFRIALGLDARISVVHLGYTGMVTMYKKTDTTPVVNANPAASDAIDIIRPWGGFVDGTTSVLHRLTLSLQVF